MTLRVMVALLSCLFMMTACLEPPGSMMPDPSSMDMMGDDSSTMPGDMNPEEDVLNDVEEDMPDSGDMSQKMCIEPCLSGQARCGDVCVELGSNAEHCGMCNTACGPGFICQAGSCGCAEGLTECDGACVDTTISDAHCGACGKSCPNGTPCNNGNCACGQDLLACRNQCVSVVDNDTHCGSCENRCGIGCAGKSCVEVVDLGVGMHHSCMVLTDGDVYCWGHNKHGETGQINPLLPPARTSTWAEVFDNLDVVQVSAGEHVTCVLTRTGEVHCVGLNTFGQLTGGDVESLTARMVNLPALATQIEIGELHVCALLQDKTVHCWGHFEFGKLGFGAGSMRIDIRSPMQVRNLSDVSAIDLGRHHTCAIAGASRNLYCWGQGSQYQLGTADTVDVFEPDMMDPSASDVLQVSAGALHTCYVKTDGDVYCVGLNNKKQTAQALLTTRAFKRVEGLPKPALHVEAGSLSTCALLEDRTVWCWGFNMENQLGGGRQREEDAQPSQVFGLQDVEQISGQLHHSCARTKQGVSCWGRNTIYQCGMGGTNVVRSPQALNLAGSWRDANP